MIRNGCKDSVHNTRLFNIAVMMTCNAIDAKVAKLAKRYTR